MVLDWARGPCTVLLASHEIRDVGHLFLYIEFKEGKTDCSEVYGWYLLGGLEVGRQLKTP